MIFYIILTLVLLLLTVFNKYISINKRYNLFWIILFIVSAFRYDVGYDYNSYLEIIINHEYGRFEFIPRMFGIISSYFNNPQIFFFLSSLFIIYFFYETIKKNSPDILLSSFIFYSVPIFFLETIDLVRQFMAISVIFYTIKYIEKRSLIKFLIFIFIAILCHRSAILFLPFYFMFNLKLRYTHIIILYILSFFLSSLLYKIIDYTNFYNNILLGHHTGGNKLNILVNIMFLFVLTFKSKIDDFRFNIVMVGVILYNLLVDFGHTGMRVSIYFTVFFILIIPDIIYKNKNILKILIYMFCIATFFNMIYVSYKTHDDSEFLPYQTIFSKI